MEKCCQTCKYNNHSKCMNEEFQYNIGIMNRNIELENENIKKYINNYIDIENITDPIINNLNDNNYISKEQKTLSIKKLNNYNEIKVNLTEILASIINQVVMDEILDNIELNYEVEPNFCCKYWE